MNETYLIVDNQGRPWKKAGSLRHARNSVRGLMAQYKTHSVYKDTTWTIHRVTATEVVE